MNTFKKILEEQILIAEQKYLKSLVFIQTFHFDYFPYKNIKITSPSINKYTQNEENYYRIIYEKENKMVALKIYERHYEWLYVDYLNSEDSFIQEINQDFDSVPSSKLIEAMKNVQI